MPAHAGAAHAASGASPRPGARHRAPCASQPPAVPGLGPAVTNTPGGSAKGVLCHRNSGIKVLPVRLVLQGVKPHVTRVRMGWGSLSVSKSQLAGDTAKATQLHRKSDGMDVPQGHGDLSWNWEGDEQSRTPNWSRVSQPKLALWLDRAAGSSTRICGQGCIPGDATQNQASYWACWKRAEGHQPTQPPPRPSQGRSLLPLFCLTTDLAPPGFARRLCVPVPSAQPGQEPPSLTFTQRKMCGREARSTSN